MSPIALNILSEAVQSSDRVIMTIDIVKGLSVKANGKVVYYAVSDRERDDVHSALEELLSEELIEELGGGDYIVTKKGCDYIAHRDEDEID